MAASHFAAAAGRRRRAHPAAGQPVGIVGGRRELRRQQPRQVGPGHALAQLGARQVEQLDEAPVPGDQAAVAIDDAQPMLQGVERRLQQLRIGFQRALAALAVGDIGDDQQHALVIGGPLDNLQEAVIAAMLHMFRRCRAMLRQALLDPALQLRVLDVDQRQANQAAAQQVFEADARLDLFGHEAMELAIPAVAEDQAVIDIEQRKGRRHALDRLAQPRLRHMQAAVELDLRGDIRGRAAETQEAAVAAQDRLAAETRAMLAAIGGGEFDDQVVEGAAMLEVALDVMPGAGFGLNTAELRQGAAEHAGRMQAGQLLEARRDIGQPRIFIGFPHPVRRRLRDVAEARLAAPQGLDGEMLPLLVGQQQAEHHQAQRIIDEHGHAQAAQGGGVHARLQHVPGQRQHGEGHAGHQHLARIAQARAAPPIHIEPDAEGGAGGDRRQLGDGRPA